jgi:hypothetical protein
MGGLGQSSLQKEEFDRRSNGEKSDLRESTCLTGSTAGSAEMRFYRSVCDRRGGFKDRFFLDLRL